MARFFVYYRVAENVTESVSIEIDRPATATQVARMILDNEVPDLWIASGALVAVKQR